MNSGRKDGPPKIPEKCLPQNYFCLFIFRGQNKNINKKWKWMKSGEKGSEDCGKRLKIF